jgi:uncharacterized membrane protein YbhN (UPF0104 family)
MKRWRNLAGSAFAVFVMGTVFYLYGRDFREIDVSNPRLLPGLAGAIAIYVGVIFIGAFGWKLLLRAFGAEPPPWIAERQLLISQIGKYVPGNVAQYLGRAAMAIKGGIPARTIGIAIVTETAAILLGGFLAVAVAFALAPELAAGLLRRMPETSRLGWLGAGAIIFVMLLLLVVLGSTFSKRLKALPNVRTGVLVAVILLYTLALLLLGLSLHLIVAALSPGPTPLSLSVAVFAAAWIAGLATPGAPGGIGVRETVITLGLAPVLGGGVALSVALLHRGASVIGDVISFGLGLLLPKKSGAHSPSNNMLAP